MQNRANHKYSPWYHLCSEGIPPHSKPDNGGWPLPLACAGRQNSGATSSPPSRKLAPAASSLGIPHGSTALLHRLLQYSGILLYLLPEVKRKSLPKRLFPFRLPAGFSRIHHSTPLPFCSRHDLYAVPQSIASALFARNISYSCKIMKVFSQNFFVFFADDFCGNLTEN